MCIYPVNNEHIQCWSFENYWLCYRKVGQKTYIGIPELCMMFVRWHSFSSSSFMVCWNNSKIMAAESSSLATWPWSSFYLLLNSCNIGLQIFLIRNVSQKEEDFCCPLNLIFKNVHEQNTTLPFLFHTIHTQAFPCASILTQFNPHFV